MACGNMAGSRILIVEDEYYLADDARTTLADVGAEVVGPVPTVEEASALIVGEGRIDGALLDINLRGEMAFDVADALSARGVPFAFVTGYDREALPERFAATPTLGKPVLPDQLVAMFEQMIAASRSAA